MTELLLPFALIMIAAFAWDFGRRWLAERAATRVSDASYEVLSSRIDELAGNCNTRMDFLEKERKALAEDWKRKFVQLEGEWKQLKQYTDGQLSGTLAQMTEGKTRGFGR